MRPTGGICDEELVSARGVDNELSVQRRQKGGACVQQDGRGQQRLGLSSDEGSERSPELRYAGGKNRCAAMPGFEGVNAVSHDLLGGLRPFVRSCLCLHRDIVLHAGCYWFARASGEAVIWKRLFLIF
jgi:hypothetical protein